MKFTPASIDAFGDRALMVRFEGPPSPELTSLLNWVARQAAGVAGVVDAAPGLTSVLVETIDPSRLQEVLPALLESAEPREGRLFEVPVHYDGEDLEWVCGHLGLTAEQVIGLHSERVYDVRLLGSPGFVYLSDVHPSIAVPRLEQPRTMVKGGSVGIGGSQAGIYRLPRPGGWRLIGTTSQVPAVRPGDRVRFLPA